MVRVGRAWVVAAAAGSVAVLALAGGGPAAAADIDPYEWGVFVPQPVVEVEPESTLPQKVRIPGEASGQAIVDVATGSTHACAVTADGEVFCWGRNDSGQVAGEPTSGETRSTRIVGLGPSAGADVVDVAAGAQHSCALTATGAVYCWGRNYSGQVGDGSTEPRYSPTRAGGSLIGRTVNQISSGDSHTCALTDGGEVWCWGRNYGGQLGDGSLRNSTTPVQVKGLPAGVAFTSVTAGGAHTCATGSDTQTYCWGSNGEGQLGDGTTEPRRSPVRVANGTGVPISSVSAGLWHTCAVHVDGTATCWGRNDHGQLGTGTTESSGVPTPVVGLPPGTAVVEITAGGRHSCLDTIDSRAFCWGANDDGQLGTGTTDASALPVPVKSEVSDKSETPVVTVVAGRNNTVGLIAPSARPGTPRDVRLEGTTLAWSEPLVSGSGTGTLSQYRVSYVAPGESKPQIFGTIPATQTGFDLAGGCPPESVCTMKAGPLTPGVKYSWYVAAVGGAGVASANSTPVPAVWAGPDVAAPVTPPVAPPDMPVVTGFEGTTLYWSPPGFAGAAGSQLAQYSIQVRPVGETKFGEYAAVPGSLTQLDLAGACPIGGICPKRGGELVPGAGYEVWVYTVGADGARSKLPRGGVPYSFQYAG